MTNCLKRSFFLSHSGWRLNRKSIHLAVIHFEMVFFFAVWLFGRHIFGGWFPLFATFIKIDKNGIKQAIINLIHLWCTPNGRAQTMLKKMLYIWPVETLVTYFNWNQLCACSFDVITLEQSMKIRYTFSKLFRFLLPPYQLISIAYNLYSMYSVINHELQFHVIYSHKYYRCPFGRKKNKLPMNVHAIN